MKRIPLAAAAALLTALLLPDPVRAADPTPGCGGRGQKKCEFASAIHAGKAQNIGCPRGSFFDPIRGGECWSCPKGYMRTLTHVENAKACAKDLLFGPWSKATYRRSVWGCNNKAGEFLDPVDGGQCYRCPANYNRSIHHVKGPLACTVYAELTCDKGLTLQGTQCVPEVDPAEKARVLAAYGSESKKYESVHASLAKGLAATQAAGPGVTRHTARRELMRKTLERHADEGFDTVTLVNSISGGLIAGYGHARGFAMSGGQCYEVFGNSFTAGVSVGVSGVEEIGIWKGGMQGLAGETNGVQGAGSLLMLTFTKGIHWAVGAKDPTGITTGTGGGAGLDFGVEYVHGWTKLRCKVDCATLNWDDIPLLDKDAACNR